MPPELFESLAPGVVALRFLPLRAKVRYVGAIVWQEVQVANPPESA